MLLKGYLAFAYLEKWNLDLIILFRPLFLSTTLLRSVPTRNVDVAIFFYLLDCNLRVVLIFQNFLNDG